MSPIAIRNLVIIAALGALVAFVPSGGVAARLVSYALSMVFMTLIVWVLATLYRRFQSDIWSLGGRLQLALYAAVAGIAVLLAAREKLGDSGPGTIVLLLGFVAVAIAIIRVVQHIREP